MESLTKVAAQVRRDIIRMVAQVKSGHPGGSLGCADFLTYLFFEQMNVTPEGLSVDGKMQDMFFLSNGHISPVLYSVMARRGYFPIEELATFRHLGSRLQGHPSPNYDLPGIRVASGSLGQGMSVAAGVATAKKMDNDPSTVYVLTGDGELQEGQNWEALMFAGANNLDNLVVTIDYNQKQIDGALDDVCSLGDLNAKLKAFNFNVLEVDGNNMETLSQLFQKVTSLLGTGKPIAVIMKTEMGMGVDFMMGTHAWHGVAPSAEQEEKALAQLPETLGDF